MYLKTTPFFVQKILTNSIWSLPNSAYQYLSFDDGPHPDSTPHILKMLKKRNIKATFFCLGKNVEQYPQLFDLIIKHQHQIGIHGYNHLSGWRTSLNNYVEDIEKAKNIINSNLFRPPFGRISYSQYQYLKTKFKLIFWSSMPGDFDIKMTKEQVLANFLRNANPGTITVLHDNPKCLSKVNYILENLDRNYKFSTISV